MQQFFLLLGSLILVNFSAISAMEIGGTSNSNTLSSEKDDVKIFENYASALRECSTKPEVLYNTIIGAASKNSEDKKFDILHVDTSKTLFLSADSLAAIYSFSTVLKNKQYSKSFYTPGTIVKNLQDKTILLTLIDANGYGFDRLYLKLDPIKKADTGSGELFYGFDRLYLKLDPIKKADTGSGELFIVNSAGKEIDLDLFKSTESKDVFWLNFLGKPKTSYFQRRTVTGLSFFAAVGIGMCGLFAWRNREAIKGFSYSTILSRFFGFFARTKQTV